MNILFLAPYYPYRDDMYTGVFFKEHARAIKTSNTDITVLAFRFVKSNALIRKREEVYTDDAGIVTHLITIESAFYKLVYAFIPWLYWICYRYIVKNRLINSSTVLYANIVAPLGVIAYWLSKKFKVSFTIIEHWSKIEKFMRLNIFSGVGRKAYSSAQHVVTVSEYLSGIVKKYNRNANNVKIIPNIIDGKIFYYSPKTKKQSIVFTAVAKWTLPKLPMVFCEALQHLHNKRQLKIELNMVGTGPLLKEIEEKKFGYKINFKGQMPKQELAELLRNTDYFLHASQIETFSVVVAEALCTGTPAIVSNVGALPELVKPSCGMLCENNVDDWYDKIGDALNTEYNNSAISDACINRFSTGAVGKSFSMLDNNG